MNDPITVGFAMCGSFCTFSRVLPQISHLRQAGYRVLPIMSPNAYTTSSRFGTAEDHRQKMEELSGNPVWHTIDEVEPIGPKKLLDILVIAPCTGNTLGKLACGIYDTSVTLSAKSHLRNNRPLVIAVSTNDGLAASAKNIGALQNYKNVFFVPYRQDDPIKKPTSLVADMDRITDTVAAALEGRQIQPVLL